MHFLDDSLLPENQETLVIQGAPYGPQYVPDGAVLSIESLGRHVLPLNTMTIAMGLHVRVGTEDRLRGRKAERISSVKQIEPVVRISRGLYREREVASANDPCHLLHRRCITTAWKKPWPRTASPDRKLITA
ncbi:3-keto-5-aminohexanoate cleavage protein [Polaromonas jejuensis]|uniref:3-keto-5-aminohexanoate cleavage protein n=1 Tax=Polaromonas jejuensis TaxID=457502 RepID=A0ABW0QDC3_9BURK|nr:3-keto-5-aminohexanoate cleavage protein [Polaromonas jejuensis]